MIKKRAFTLTELLGVLVILGLILIVAIPSFNTLQKKFKSDYYEKMDGNVLVIGKNYFKDNSESRPVSLLEYNSVDYGSLIKNQYLDSINQYNSSTKCTGKVVILKTNSEYKYKNCMDCGEYRNYENVKYDVNSIDNLCHLDNTEIKITYPTRNVIYAHVNNYTNQEIKNLLCLARTVERRTNDNKLVYSEVDSDDSSSKCPMNISAIDLKNIGSYKEKTYKVKYSDDQNRNVIVFQHPAPTVKNSTEEIIGSFNIDDILTLSIDDLKTFGPNYNSTFSNYQYRDGDTWKNVVCDTFVEDENYLCIVNKSKLDFSSEKIGFRVVGRDIVNDKPQYGKPSGDYELKVKVTLDPAGGSVDTTELYVSYNKTYGRLPDPTRTDFVFDGWHTSPNDSATVYETTKVTTKSNHTLYAHWILNVFNVKFFANKFATINQTINGVTVKYDSSSSELTLNGTASTSIPLMRLAETFIKDTKYSISLQYISGSFSSPDAKSYITTAIRDADGNELTTTNYKSVELPMSGEKNGTLTISELGQNDGAQLYVRVYKNNKTTLSFDNYKIKITISQNETWRVTNGKRYSYGNSSSFTTPKRIGHKFDGWYTSESGGTKINASNVAKISEDETLYAHWTPYTVTIKYNVNGGTISANTDRFTTDSHGYVQVDGEIHSNVYNYGTDMINSGLTNYNYSNYLYVLKANYTGDSKNEWKCETGTCKGLTFDQRDISDTHYKPSDFCDASTSNCVANLYINWIPYLYLDWELDGVSYTGNFDYATADVYIDDAVVASGVSDYSHAWQKNKKYEIKNITPITGYECSGVASGSSSLSGTISGVTTVKVKCNAKKVKVTFMRNTSSTDATKDEQTFTYNVSGQTFSEKRWSKSGYTLAGWSHSKDATSATYRKTSGVANSWINSYSPEVTLYAVWDTNSYYLDLNASVDGVAKTSLSGIATADVKISGTVVSNDVNDYYQKHDYNTSYEILDIKPATGYTYKGVVTGSSPVSGKVTGATTVTLNFESTSYSISYNYKTGNCDGTLPTSGVPSTYKYGTGATIDGKPSKTGYVFNGWSENSSLTGAAFSKSISKTATGNKTFYAKCCQTCATVSNGSCSLDASTAGTCKYTTSCNTGYTLTSGANTRSPVCSPVTYTVTYNMNGGTGGPSNQTKTYNTTLVLSTTEPKRTGYVFMGWGTSASTKTSSYKPGNNYTSNSNITLYALWKKTVTVTFDRYKLLWMSNVTRTCDMWNADKTCSVTAPAITAIPGSSSRGSSNDSTYKGYGNQTFTSLFDYDGWDSRKDVYPAAFQPNESINVSSNITYYANISLKTKYFVAFPNNQYGLYCRKNAGDAYEIANFTGLIDTNWASVYASFTATNYFAWQYTTSGDYRLWIRGSGTPLMNDTGGHFPNGTCSDKWVPANWLSWSVS